MSDQGVGANDAVVAAIKRRLSSYVPRMTQNELADRLGMRRNTLQGYLNDNLANRVELRMPIVWDIADALHVPIEELIADAAQLRKQPGIDRAPRTGTRDRQSQTSPSGDTAPIPSNEAWSRFDEAANDLGLTNDDSSAQPGQADDTGEDPPNGGRAREA